MKTLIKIFIPIIVFCYITFWIISCSNLDKKNPACTGKDRWDVKTLTDAGASAINYTPSDTTVASLIAVPLQTTPAANTPRFGIEFRTFTVRCRIREYKLSSDGDYHLVMTDLADASKTMIGEIPDPYCQSVQQSAYISDFTKARKDFQNTLLATAQVDTSVYIITGVAFFDKVHGQLGAAPTAIEIHPILSISKK